MASTVTVTPSLGHGSVSSQVGPAAGYDAIDDRRQWAATRQEGLLSDGSYLVAQNHLGAGPNVDVNASTGNGVLVQGDSVTAQGLYLVPPHSGVITVDIAAGDVTNPRNDLVILEVKDDTHDSSGLNLSRVRVITGTPNASAAVTDAFGVNGTPALPVTAVPLAVVRQPAGGTNITTTMIDDRRFRVAGASVIAGPETFSPGASYVFATTPDRVRNVVVPANAILNVAVLATVTSSVSAAGTVGLFIGANQAKTQTATPTVIEVQTQTTTATAIGTTATSLSNVGSYTGDVATGEAILTLSLFVTAGTYDVGLKVKASSGTLTMTNRRLLAWVQPFPG